MVGNDFAVGDLVWVSAKPLDGLRLLAIAAAVAVAGVVWQRTGAAPDARLTPVETADNLFLRAVIG